MKQFNIYVFAINADDIWLAYQGITGTAETQAGFYNCLSEAIIDNTYDRFMMRSTEVRRRTIVDSDGKTFDDDNPLLGRINGSPICGISLHVTPTNKIRKKRDGTKTQYFLQGECKVCQKKKTYVCSYFADTDAVKNEMCFFHPDTKCSYFA